MFTPQDINNIMKTDEHTKWLNVVGVVHDIRLDDLDGAVRRSASIIFRSPRTRSAVYTFAIKGVSGLRLGGPRAFARESPASILNWRCST